MASLASPPPAPGFNAAQWLGALTAIGGGYALGSARQLHLLVQDCEADDLTGVMAQIAGHRDRQEAVRRAIERHQAGEA